mgnify:CR=1 FL=1
MTEPEKKKRTLSKETRAKISAARRLRKVQPRSGQSKKRQTIYRELLFDYKGSPEAVEWLKNHKDELNGGHEQAADWGILTEYDEQKIAFHEFRIGAVLFKKHDDTEMTDEEKAESFIGDGDNESDEDDLNDFLHFEDNQ